ncbi:hypothetical protein SAMN04488137_2625 [Fictibacillus solisalsi]|uniref:Uncharacterized protein n=1 Tax=Fictibacillus solisalsi TaxID=459525 RepID=A0A1G9X7R0_9BACL|nr:hypothetical protein [Fictibacillus solisalsi]SDM92790.1 hypothetical protein SAMN04488137_2625 [Fictibacillus solisalsi]
MNFKNTLTAGLIISLIGLLFLIKSATFGYSMAVSWLSDFGDGGANPSDYNTILKSYITIFVILGSLLFAFGLFFISFSFIKLCEMKGVDKL